MNPFTGFLLLVCGFCGVLVALSAYMGLAIKLLWGWFIVPLGAPPITLIHAMGLVLILALFKTHRPKNKYDESTTGLMWVTPAFSMLFGWLIHLWM